MFLLLLLLLDSVQLQHSEDSETLFILFVRTGLFFLSIINSIVNWCFEASQPHRVRDIRDKPPGETDRQTDRETETKGERVSAVWSAYS